MSQSVTKSSHYVSVRQERVGGTTTSSSRYLTWSSGGKGYCCSLQGMLRAIEILLLVIILILSRIGFHGHHLIFGGEDAEFMGIGCCVGILATVIILVTCHLIGHVPSPIMEVLVNLVGCILLLATGSLSCHFYSRRYDYNRDSAAAGLALGILTVIAGVVFLIHLIVSLRHLKISVTSS